MTGYLHTVEVVPIEVDQKEGFLVRLTSNGNLWCSQKFGFWLHDSEEVREANKVNLNDFVHSKEYIVQSFSESSNRFAYKLNWI